MLNFEEIAPALTEINRRLSKQGEERYQAVGTNNQLQGQVYYLDFHSHLFLILLSGLNSDKPHYSCIISERPYEEYLANNTAGLDHRMSIPWATILEHQAEALRHFQPCARRDRATTAPPPLPAAEYPVLAAALTQRMQVWNISNLHLSPRVSPEVWGDIRSDVLRQWWPRLAPDLTGMSTRSAMLDLSQLVLPWPICTDGVGMDALDFYRRYPNAHGKLYLGPPTFSVDGRQAILSLRHSLGFELGNRDSRRLPQPDGSMPGKFLEILWLEKGDIEWNLSGHLRYDVESPPALLEAQEQERIQAELGEWGTVLKVVVDSSHAVEAEVHTPLGTRRVICAPAFAQNTPDLETPLVIQEATVWIFSYKITGQAIVRALSPAGERP